VPEEISGSGGWESVRNSGDSSGDISGDSSAEGFLPGGSTCWTSMIRR